MKTRWHSGMCSPLSQPKESTLGGTTWNEGASSTQHQKHSRRIEIHTALWDLLRALAPFAYRLQYDHLCDADLYAYGLRCATRTIIVPPPVPVEFPIDAAIRNSRLPGGHIDLVALLADEDMRKLGREARHRKSTYDRDRFLPTPADEVNMNSHNSNSQTIRPSFITHCLSAINHTLSSPSWLSTIAYRLFFCPDRHDTNPS